MILKNPIYVPKGRAGEYGDYALNIYTGCPQWNMQYKGGSI